MVGDIAPNQRKVAFLREMVRCIFVISDSVAKCRCTIIVVYFNNCPPSLFLQILIRACAVVVMLEFH